MNVEDSMLSKLPVAARTRVSSCPQVFRLVTKSGSSTLYLNGLWLQQTYDHPQPSMAHHFLSVNVNGQLSCSTISNPFLIPFLEESHLTIGKIVAKTLISSDCGVAWCVQSSNKLALPRNSAKLSCA